MAKLNCVLIGDESLLVQCAEMLRARDHAITAIVTGRASVRDWAEAAGIAVVEWSADLSVQLAAVDYDWLFSVANLRMIPDAVWQRAGHGAINFHDGPLPEFAGLNTPSWAIIEGAATHGVTWHAITAGIDEGDVYARASFDVSDDETVLTLNSKCFEAGIATFGELLDQIEGGTLAPQHQDFSTRRYFGRYLRPDAAATLRFERPAAELSRLVRGLSFGDGYANPLVTSKVRAEGKLFSVTRLEVTDEPGGARPGSVLALGERGALVATADNQVWIDGELRHKTGKTGLASLLKVGASLPLIDETDARDLSAAVAEIVPNESFFSRALAAASDIDLPDVKSSQENEPDLQKIALDLPRNVTGDDRIVLIGAFLQRLSGQQAFTLAYANDDLAALQARHAGYFAPAVPLRIEGDDGTDLTHFTDAVQQSLQQLRKRRTYLRDLVDRSPAIAELNSSFGILETAAAEKIAAIEGCALTFVLEGHDGQAFALYDRNRITDAQVRDYVKRLDILSAAFAAGTEHVADLPLLSREEEQRVLYDLNQSERNYERSTCVHELIERQVDLTPDAIALAYRDQSLTYRQMDERANSIARALVEMGVGPDMPVGLCVGRSLDLVVGALAIQKAGGAYLPLDPDFPADRLSFMVEDSGIKVVLTDRAHAASPSLAGAKVLCVEDVLARQLSTSRVKGGATSANLAYVIYTSGSTGRPKGVMVEHRNVVNFFAGMDERVEVGSQGQPVWLAVTSLSFDISVLELFWTLTRGFKVVVYSGEAQRGREAPILRTASQGAIDFGLFYWGNDDGAGPAKYRLLLEGAKFADEHGFQSVWTPERHFHAFGGPYPNPAVTGAAVAAVTKQLSIRAGSCVLPLHHPARVVEEWAVIDNLSNGRAALAFASGWMPEDFILRPENAPPNNKASMIRDIETVRQLWRGESVDFEFGKGKVSVVTQPRPVQKELPIWLTTAGNPETYREAARLGANVLTHLLGQSIDEVAEKIKIYRETLVEVGRNPADYTVTLMLHTLLGEDREEVRRQARGPMKDYLRSAAALIKQYAWAFPAFKKPQGVTQPMDIDLQSLDAEELDAILEFAFLRYFEDSGLFGTVDDARQRIEQVAAAGVDDIACLIDFGVPSELVMERLVPLAQVVAQVRGSADLEPATEWDGGFATEIRRHGVTHLQCTPSMASMFLMGDEDRRALGGVQHLYIGGEALQGALLAELAKVSEATVENMYGPTETTIWSSTLTAQKTEGVVPLGRPIANTQLYVLDRARRPVPPGLPGELYIGGDGVTRGYLHRDELTAERFLPNPFMAGRIYRTGDLVRLGADGTLHFLGRADFQVKVRGYRIELGEIEARIGSYPGVREAVVVAREDRANDVRIVAYIRAPGVTIDERGLRAHIAEVLPDYMVPAHFVTLDAFPLTPNAKVDRNRLPKPEEVRSVPAAHEYVAPSDNTQIEIAEAFRRALGLERVGLHDSFFALGGHSLLAVQVHRELRSKVAPELTITDLFRFPTVSGLAAHIADRGKADERLSRVADRAAMRRNALGDRRAGLVRSRDTG